MSDDKKKKGEEESRAYSGTKIPVDDDLLRWLQHQWKRGETLQRIDVVQFFSKGANKGFGEVVDFEMFGPNREVNAEEAVDITNRFVGAAQRDCDRVIRKPMVYYVRAYDRGRAASSDPVSSYPLRVEPRTVYLSKPGEMDGDGDEHPRETALSYIKELISVHQAERARDDNNMGEHIALLINERREERQWIMRLMTMNQTIMNDWVAAVRGQEEARSNEAERTVRVEVARIKAEMLRDGFRVGKNALTAFIGSITQPQQGNEIATTQGGGGQAPREYQSPERNVIEEFFHDCKSAKIEVALFGEWGPGDNGGPPRCTKEGIFRPDQFLVFARVAKGLIPPDALDDLMPDSGSPLAIQMEQLARAQELEGMTDGIAMSLMSLVSMRKKAQEARAAKMSPPAAATAPTSHATTTSTTGDADV